MGRITKDNFLSRHCVDCTVKEDYNIEDECIGFCRYTFRRIYI